MIPPSLSRDDVLRAIDRLLGAGWSSRRNSTKFDLLWKGKRYPPKEVIREAAEVAGIELDAFGGGAETNSFLERRGFVVVGKRGALMALKPAEEDPEAAFSEGSVVFRRHRIRERSGRAPRIAKERRLAETGELRCDVCDFSFLDVFGERGAGFIEAHHDRPLSQASEPVRTRPGDFSLVCSNCHRMLHANPWITAKELRKLLSERPANGPLQRTGLRSSAPRSRR